jgi:flagellar M-ring protein FliF
VDPQQLIGRLKTVTSSFSTGQLAAMGGAFLLVVAMVGGSTMWMNKPSYVLLFSDMDAESAGQVVTRLKSEKVPYQLDEGGRGIRVPAERVDELRLELSSQGLPSTGRVGFEIFDRTSFGATEFQEQINYRRALEGEIARTIATISEVANARVHIAMGKEQLFGEPQPAKASVVLKLKGQRALSVATVTGIENLVASSVQGLRPEAVVILDSFGRPLTRADGETADAGDLARGERQQRLEKEMSARVIALLEPVVGAEHVRVNVALKLNPRTSEETQELWDPNSVVRSRQTTADQATSASALGAVAGTRGNTPPPPPAPGAPANPPAPAAPLLAAGPGSSRTAETTNYEISRTTRHTIQPAGEIARLSVAVVLDDDQTTKKAADGTTKIVHQPRTQAELQKIHGVIAAAVGLEPDRGDQLTVENVAFDEPLVEQVAAPTVLEKITPQLWEGGRIGAVILVGLLTLLLVVRPMMRHAGVLPPARQPAAASVPAAAADVPAARTVADIQSEMEAQIDAEVHARLNTRRLPALTKRVTALTTKEPENVAKLLRGWMTEAER